MTLKLKLWDHVLTAMYAAQPALRVLALEIYQSATNAKITQFDLPFGIQQDIRWLNVSVNDTMFLF